MTGSLIRDWFGWDGGAVLTNLVASLIWAGPTVILAARKLRRMHRHILQLHEKLDQKETV